MARPTDYGDHILEKSREYIEKYRDYGDVVPTVAGLSVKLGIARSTLYDWASQEEKREFSDIIESLLAEQEKVTLSEGLKGEFNSTIAKLLLGKHGYHEKVDSQLTGANNGAIQVQGWILEGVKPSDTSPST